MGRYLDLARRALESSRGILPYEKNEINEKRTNDPYQDLARATLAKIRRPDYPMGLLPWLRENHLTLYEALISNLPDEIHRLWEGRAPLPEFQRILDLWLVAHRTGCEMYQGSHSKSRMGEELL
jgi:hypothetical protein